MSTVFEGLAPSKINLGLWVRNRRPDGYHEIETIFVPVLSLADKLRIEVTPEVNAPQLHLRGRTIPGQVDDNLCLRAWRLLRNAFGERIRPVRIDLTKTIPIGSGLGGGSSDAATCLLAFDRLFDLGLGVIGLRPFARQLGADVTFFLDPRPCLARGIGDELEPIALPDLGKIDVRWCDIHSDTARAYRELDLNQCTRTGDLRTALQQPREHWCDSITNDFERGVFVRFPELAAVKAQLYAEGAYFALMSGSGSAVYGLFHTE